MKLVVEFKPTRLEAQIAAPMLTVTTGKQVVKEYVNADYYDGEYFIEPTEQEQTIPIALKIARQNVTVGAIPSNYGRIAWTGTTLKVF